jgi:hypothetical protein
MGMRIPEIVGERPIRQIPIGNIAKIQPAHDREQIAKYRADIRNGKEIEPLPAESLTDKVKAGLKDVGYDFPSHITHVLIDGHHRLAALRAEGITTIPIWEYNVRHSSWL